MIGGCTIYPAQPWTTRLVQLNAFGAGFYAEPLPANPALRGLTIHAQAAVLDASVARGFSATASQRIRLGHG